MSGSDAVTKRVDSFVPRSLRGYRPGWLRADVLAGVSLAAVAIPEAMGYSSIAQVPISAGLYSLILPTIMFALLGASRLMVVGADSATAALLASGIGGLGLVGLAPSTPEWLAWAGLVALMTAGLLIIARILRLGFLGDFLSSAVLTGFLSGVGFLLVTEQIPGLLGLDGVHGEHVIGKWISIVRSLDTMHWTSVGFGILTVAGFFLAKKFRPGLPSPIIIVVGAIAAVMIFDLATVRTIGTVEAGIPTISFPPLDKILSVMPELLTLSFGCLLVILAQSAATARSFGQKHGDQVDVNRDIVGLAAANASAALTGSFVVNGSPTKTAVLDQQRGRTQVANLTMALATLAVVAFAAPLLSHLPAAVLAGIVFAVGIDLIDITAFRRIWKIRRVEFAIAIVTALMVMSFGVLTGIVTAMVLSLLQMIHRQYVPDRFVISLSDDGHRRYESASAGAQTMPGLIIFRYDADLFYANVGRFSDDVTALVRGAPDPVRWLVLDCSAVSDVDYSAARALRSLIDFVHSNGARFILAGVSPELGESLETAQIMTDLAADSVYPGVGSVVRAYRATFPES